MQIRVLPLLCAAALGVAPAFGADVSGALTGFVYDSAARAIRPVLGIPGAAVLGSPLDLGFALANASIAPGQDFAVGVGEDGSVRLVRLDNRAAQAMDTLHGAPIRIAFSPRGASAAFLNTSTLDVFTGLPDKPVLARTLDLAGLETPSALAVSDDGNAVLIAAGGAVRAAGQSAEWKTLQPGSWVFAFVPDSHDAAVAGPGGAVAVLRDVAGAGERAELAAPVEDASGASAVAVAPGGRVVVAQDRKISLIDPSGELVGTWLCDCSPAGLHRMGSTFRLSEVSREPLWLLDGFSRESRLVFVPPAAPEKPAEND